MGVGAEGLLFVGLGDDGAIGASVEFATLRRVELERLPRLAKVHALVDGQTVGFAAAELKTQVRQFVLFAERQRQRHVVGQRGRCRRRRRGGRRRRRHRLRLPARQVVDVVQVGQVGRRVATLGAVDVALRRRGRHFFAEGGVDEVGHAASRPHHCARRRRHRRHADAAVGQAQRHLLVARIRRVLLRREHLQESAAATVVVVVVVVIVVVVIVVVVVVVVGTGVEQTAAAAAAARRRREPHADHQSGQRRVQAARRHPRNSETLTSYWFLPIGARRTASTFLLSLVFCCCAVCVLLNDSTGQLDLVCDSFSIANRLSNRCPRLSLVSTDYLFCFSFSSLAPSEQNKKNAENLLATQHFFVFFSNRFHCWPLARFSEGSQFFDKKKTQLGCDLSVSFFVVVGLSSRWPFQGGGPHDEDPRERERNKNGAPADGQEVPHNTTTKTVFVLVFFLLLLLQVRQLGPPSVCGDPDRTCPNRFGAFAVLFCYLPPVIVRG